MVTVDSKGRIVLPKEVRERLGITPGSEVEVHEEGGKAVVELEDEPDRIIDRMDDLMSEAAADRDPVPYEDLDVHARDHADTVRRGAREANVDDE